MAAIAYLALQEKNNNLGLHLKVKISKDMIGEKIRLNDLLCVSLPNEITDLKNRLPISLQEKLTGCFICKQQTSLLNEHNDFF